MTIEAAGAGRLHKERALVRLSERDIGPPIATALRIGIIAVFLSVWFVRADLTETSPRLLLAAVVTAMGAEVLLVARRDKARGVALAIAGMAGMAVLLSVALSDSWRIALEWSIVPLGFLVAFVYGANGPLRRSDLTWAIAYAGGWVAVATIVGSVSQVLSWVATYRSIVPDAGLLESWPMTLLRAAPSGSHPNAAGGFIALSLVLLALKKRPADRWIRRLRWASLSILGTGLILTGSRGAAAGAIVGLAIGSSLKGWKRPKWVLWVAVGVGAVGSTAYAFGFRPQSVFRGTFGDRFAVFEATFRMWERSPWFGNGPGAYGRLVDQYLLSYPGLDGRFVWNHPHNIFLQLLAEFGVAGALVGLALVWKILKAGSRSWNSVDMAAVAGGLIAVGVHGMVDTVGLSLSVGMGSALLAGSMLRDQPTSGARTLRWVAGAIFLSVPLIVLAGLPGQSHFDRGIAAASAGQWQNAEVSFEAAASLDPLPTYRLMAGLSQAMVGVVPPTEQHPETEWHRGIGLLNKGALTGDIGAVRAGILLVQSDEVALIQAAWLLDSEGLRSESDEVLIRAVQVNPHLAASPLWHEFSGDNMRRIEILSAVGMADPCAIVREFVWSGWEDEIVLSNAVTSCPPGSEARMTALWSRGQYAELANAARSIIRAVRDDPLARFFSGVAHERLGERSAAIRDWTTAALLGDPMAAVELATKLPGTPSQGLLNVLASVVRAHSPVVVYGDGSAVHDYAFFREGTVSMRTGMPQYLVDGAWKSATTDLHDEIVRIIDSSS